MRCKIFVLAGWMIVAGSYVVRAEDRPIEELPRDIWNLATVWTEPIRQAAKRSRDFDPVSGVCFGIVDGSVKAIGRTAVLFFPHEKNFPGTERKGAKPILRYSF